MLRFLFVAVPGNWELVVVPVEQSPNRMWNKVWVWTMEQIEYGEFVEVMTSSLRKTSGVSGCLLDFLPFQT